MQSVAAVGIDGSIDWLCLPRFDSPACFAALLGDEHNGSWRIAPSAGGSATRRYQGDTLILETEWHTDTGTARVIDFMPRRDAGAPLLARIVEGVQGSVEMDCVLRLRFGYGQVLPWMRRLGSTINATAGPDSIYVTTPVRLEGRDMAHRATFTVHQGERVPFTLTWVESHRGRPQDCDPADALEETRRYWDDWVAHCTYQGQYRDAVVRSLITLKALTYAPTGGIVAAPTTSLPEWIGSVRNW
ncbi:MAG: glycoside hydrolase family 15 protein, partial [Streptosporangiaceae bacterium]